MLAFVVKYLLIFFVGSLIGYLIEVFYRRFVSQKRWMNPGFLKGPYLPLYGFGLVALYVICSIDLNIPRVYEVITKSIIILVAMTLIELIAGLIFVKGMKIKLWDYSDRWLNFEGIICPLYSFFWGIIGFGYFMYIHPLIVDVVNYWSQNQILSFFVGAIFGIFIVDVVVELNVATKISAFAHKHNMTLNYEVMRTSIKELPGKIKDKINNSKEIYKENVEVFLNNEKNVDRFAIAGFITSFLGFIAFPLGLSLIGLKSKKYKKLAIAGIVITAIEIILLIVFGFLYRI
ncbi:MAG: putative ABC transporter permease [Anaeroplasmataceae bacterium]